MNTTEKMLIQKILESDLAMQEKLDILVEAGVPLGAEYAFDITLNAEQVSTEFLARLSHLLLNDPEVISFGINNLRERELGEDDWTDKKWDLTKLPKPIVTAPTIPSTRVFVTTGQQSTKGWNGPYRPVNLHITDDGYNTLCGRNVPPKWKTAPYVEKATSYKNKVAKICAGCENSASNMVATVSVP
jgi:hypothetical protein